MTTVNIITIASFFVFDVICAQDYFEMRHLQHIRTPKDGSSYHLKTIPKKFEVKGDNPSKEFRKYIEDIQALADRDNKTIVYSVKVDVVKPTVLRRIKKIKKIMSKSKKYNVPLKKKNMRLSNYEIIMRKLIDNNSQNKVVINPVMTTHDITGEIKISSTTKIPIMKYKPIISRVRTKYEKKIIKPIRKNEIVIPVKLSKHH